MNLQIEHQNKEVKTDRIEGRLCSSRITYKDFKILILVKGRTNKKNINKEIQGLNNTSN